MKIFARAWALSTAVTVLYALASSPSASAQTTLYDGSLGTTPTAQGWPLTALPSAGASESYDATNQLTTLSTLGTDINTSNGTYAGYARNNVTLSRNGFTLNVNLRINSETHVSVNRAGVSLIALNEDKRGVELGFWTDTIQVQNLVGNEFQFDALERASVSTTALTTYSLTFTSNTYTLISGGTTLMSGNLRDYTPYVGTIDPYETANFLFLGDDTTSARGSFSLQRATLSAATSAPEPASLALTFPLMTMAIYLYQRKSRSASK